MILNDEDRQRFSKYLEIVKYSSEQIMEQFTKSSMPENIIQVMTVKEKVLIAACAVIINHLKSSEIQEIS